MKAYVLHGINDLRYEDVKMPECPDNWAIVKVMASGICSSDIPRIFSKGTYSFPTIPGHEFAGVVYQVKNSRYEYLVGKRVGIFPLIPCRNCQQCQRGHYEMCSNYDYLGSRRDGGFAEYVSVPIWNMIPLSDNISFTSAALLEPLAVALHAVKMGNIQNGYRVGVVGTGMIGICAALWAKILGADTAFVLGRSEHKRSLVQKMNLEYEIISSENNFSFDLVIEAVGSTECIQNAIQFVSPGGTLVLMGNPSGDVKLPQDIYWRILRKQLLLKGTWNSSYKCDDISEWTEAVDALQNGIINVDPLITHRYLKENLIDGLNLMKEHKEVYCKIVTIWN